MELQNTLVVLLLLVLLLIVMSSSIVGFGSTGPISAAFGDDGFFCAIDASGKQQIFCWKKDNSSTSASAYFSSLPSMATLSGGEGFMCGIISNTSQPYCWNSLETGTDLVPLAYKYTAYSHIAAGKNHVCGIRGFYYSLDSEGSNSVVDCWQVDQASNNTGQSVSNPNISNLAFKKIVSGENFSCGGVIEGGIVCWGSKSESLGVSSDNSDTFLALASGRNSICGITEVSGEVKCWGEVDSFGTLPVGTRFVALSAGLHHFCGIREDDHGIECWGADHDASLIPKNSGFLAIASSDFTTCGVREDDLIIDCWGMQKPSLPPDYSPPLQLCSPGLCTSGTCGEGMFAFNASILSVPDLTSLCVREDLRICSPCGSNCSTGFFASSACSENADRVCTACSLCQNSSCWDICGHASSSELRAEQQHEIKKLAIIIGSSVLGFMLVVIGWCFFPCTTTEKEERGKPQSQYTCCVRTPKVEEDIITEQTLPLSRAQSVGTAQAFRLSDLKDATNGFKEFNELGRGSYGFVYKAIIADGQHVAVKRANASTIIHTNSRDFEAELEILCNVRHANVVNLLGYCAEMGERLLVYEFMPHGTLHDHLHGGLSSLNWNLRLRISMQAAKGLEYLHNGVVPPIVHRDIKASNILLDSEWGGRIADFGLTSTGNKDPNGDLESDVYSFGIVLLEILSGRKAYDNEYTPPGIVEWAVPLIRQGKAAAIIDRNVALPRNVEPLLKLAEIAELAVKKEPNERAKMSDLAIWLEQIVDGGLTL